jgi:hypothetical protein
MLVGWIRIRLFNIAQESLGACGPSSTRAVWQLRFAFANMACLEFSIGVCCIAQTRF